MFLITIHKKNLTPLNLLEVDSAHCWPAWSLFAVLACAESDSKQCWPACSCLFHDLRDNEFLREQVLFCLSGAQMGSSHEKNGKKSHDTATSV